MLPFLLANHKGDVPFLVEADGLIQIQPRQGWQLAFPVQGDAFQLARLEPLLLKTIHRIEHNRRAEIGSSLGPNKCNKCWATMVVGFVFRSSSNPHNHWQNRIPD